VIPLGLKVVYTIFVCVLVPIYWREYGPANFLWFSDIALLALVPALWLENALLVSMLALSVVFFEALWNVDFFFRLATGRPLIGLSAYMFDPKIPLFIRGLSCFHIVLPLLLLWMLHRLGYDQRAFLWQTIVALVVLPLSYLVSNARENVNWVYGLGENPQRILPAPLFICQRTFFSPEFFEPQGRKSDRADATTRSSFPAPVFRPGIRFSIAVFQL
jgi:hypothetical protein